MGKYTYRFCSKEDVEGLVEFIDSYWSKSHILVRNRALLDWQYYNSVHERYNFALACCKETNEIHGLLGYISTSHYDNDIDNDEIWLSIWKVREDKSATGVGFKLLKYLTAKLNPTTICSVGLSEMVIPMYETMGFNQGVLEHHIYLRNGRKQFGILSGVKGIESKHINSHIKHTKIDGLNITTIQEVVSDLAAESYPKKTARFIFNRYINHPYYEYLVHHLRDHEAREAILVLRVSEHEGCRALRIVDFLGDHELFGSIGGFIQGLLIEFDAEYADLLSFGIPCDVIERGGGLNRRRYQDLLVPNYFEPFVQANIEVAFAFESEHTETFRIFKADSDQDRPNLIDTDLGTGRA